MDRTVDVASAQRIIAAAEPGPYFTIKNKNDRTFTHVESKAGGVICAMSTEKQNNLAYVIWALNDYPNAIAEIVNLRQELNRLRSRN